MSDLSVPLTPRDAAAALGVDETTVRKWIAQGRLRAAKSGRRWTIAARDLDALRRPERQRATAPDSAALLEALRQLEALRRENVQLAGQLGYVQSQLEVERDRVRALEAPREPGRRPWWRVWG